MSQQPHILGHHLGHQQVFTAKTGLGSHQGIEAAQQQATTCQQTDRRGHLHGNQDRAQTGTGRRRRYLAPTRTQAGEQRNPPIEHDRRQGQHQGQSDRQGERQQHGRAIDGHCQRGIRA